MTSALYIVRPLPTGLYELAGPTLPYPLLFKGDAAPLNHAHFCGRGTERQGARPESQRGRPCSANDWLDLWRVRAGRIVGLRPTPDPVLPLERIWALLI